jgi:anti-anti-sigma regulatory factor
LELEERPVAVVAPVGDGDAFSAERLKAEIAVLVSAGYPIVVDLTEGTLDSQTLSVLLGGRRQAGRADFRFMLALSEGDVSRGRRILEILGLDSSMSRGRPLRPRAGLRRSQTSPASHPGSGRSQRQGAGIT